MDALDLALHGLNFLAPAWFLALAMVWGARIWPRAWLAHAKLSWSMQLLLQGLLGSAVLIGGLWGLGADGKMLTYAGLIVSMASLQWLLSRGWRR